MKTATREYEPDEKMLGLLLSQGFDVTLGPSRLWTCNIHLLFLDWHVHACLSLFLRKKYNKRMNVLAENKRARFDYELLETLQAGLELTGHETKSLKLHGGGMPGAHIIIRGNEAFVVGLDIHSFQEKNAPENYDSMRTRKLLLQKEEIKTLLGKTKTGLTIVPTKLYSNARGLIKVEIAIARGRKAHDKRELLKKREDIREIRKWG